jgi:hypothetical protein
MWSWLPTYRSLIKIHGGTPGDLEHSNKTFKYFKSSFMLRQAKSQLHESTFHDARKIAEHVCPLLNSKSTA